jgi:methionyl-tRNA synthetase
VSKPANSYHLTTAIPYVNAKPHLGHVLEWFQADVIARYQRSLGKDVSFTSGADENSLKNVQAAEKANKEPQAWLDEYAEIFQDAYKFFDISLTGFRRGSDQKLHWPGVQKLWQLCADSGDIYKKTYKGLYCLGCESFYSPDELIDGKCPEHLTAPETVEEENYFFRLSKYETEIRRLIESDELRIVSDQYKNEMLGFINKGLEDFSVSRTKSRARGFGVPVPRDENHIMYVWFDALAIYMTAIGWDYDVKEFEKYWPADVHIIGKGINRFHSVYWIGMLLSAKLSTPKTVCVHGYITANGQKMSKSLGNVIDPFELVERNGLEPVRYYLLKEIPTHSDGDFSDIRFRELYTADLANGLGNLCSRVAKLCERAEYINKNAPAQKWSSELGQKVVAQLDNFEINKALEIIAEHLRALDGYLSEQTPWKKPVEQQQEILAYLVKEILATVWCLEPFLPRTAQTIHEHFAQEKITALQPLFPRLPEA